MAKMQCECGSYLFYIYEEVYGNKVVCVREENEGMSHHKALIQKNEYTGESK